MKGLLIKDAEIMKNQGRILLLLVAFAVVFLGMNRDMTVIFIVSYITIVLSLFTASTVSYDEFDNCWLFLMTLPVTRKRYVQEKYLFGILLTLGAWCLANAVGAVLMVWKGMSADLLEWLGESTAVLCVAFVFMGVTLPLRLKLDAEKAKYINLLVFILVFGGAFLVSKLVVYVPRNIRQTVSALFGDMGNQGILLLSAGIAAAVLLVSYGCSRRIMARKEF